MPRALLISVILIAWNNKTHLRHCFSALSKQTLRDFEFFLIDNASTDNSAVELYPSRSDLHLLVERFQSDLGFAAANNIGVRFAHGEWLALLNAVAFPELHWLVSLLHVAEQKSRHNFFTSRQIQYRRAARVQMHSK